ncbi:MAG: glutaminyl-peptide cyclotransferase [Bacteroidales bacterium]|jgi:glutamine cyclotransferase|nr:glutaminyl-peptide cyclotransferase [Bacteroidales bacterium]
MKISKSIIGSIILLTFFLFQISCSNQKRGDIKQDDAKKTEKVTKRVSVIKIDAPKAGEMFTIGDNIEINIGLKEIDIEIDSLIVESNRIKSVLQTNNLVYNWETKNLKVGSNQLKVFAYSNGNKVDSYYLKLRFKSDIKPELYECKIVNTYSHDKRAYTQGLIYENGIMYEGTGQYGESVLRKVNFKSGEIIAELSLESKYFGEGITIFKDKIIQLTLRSNKGFVYDKKSFKLISTLGYSTQGWGITTDGKKLIMSDGTQTIHFLDPEYFNEIGKIDVYDNNGPVESLNELEFIEGLVYANVYQTEEIIAFDPITGKVLKRIDCRKIVPNGFQGETDNVLNGIAWDKQNDRYFITGKRWPSLFEVKFVKM